VTSFVSAAHPWPSNAELIADIATLGYLDGKVLDVTYGLGTFWKVWQPDDLTGCDLDPYKSQWPNDDYGPQSVDFTHLPFERPFDHFDAVVFDPPYKLNGTPDEAEARYGTHEITRWQDRMSLIEAGVVECCRVSSRYVLVKCQDQVCSGQIRWQTILVTDTAAMNGFGLVERFDMLGTGRPQPEGRSQVHARNRPSTLLVFERAKGTNLT